jgi:hypothetical protein
VSSGFEQEWDGKLKGRTRGHLPLSIGLSTSKALVSVGAVDGRYARVLPRDAALKLVDGGVLHHKDTIAFTTEYSAIEGVASPTWPSEHCKVCNE